jgi:hypothetical protein
MSPNPISHSVLPQFVCLVRVGRRVDFGALDRQFGLAGGGERDLRQGVKILRFRYSTIR